MIDLDFNLDATKENLDKFTESLKNSGDENLRNYGIRLETGIKDALNNQDLTKLNKLLKDVNKHK